MLTLTVIGLVAVLVAAFVVFAYAEQSRNNKQLDAVAKAIQFRRATQSGTHVEMPEELASQLGSTDLAQQRPSAQAYGMLQGADQHGSAYMFRYVWQSKSSQMNTTMQTVVCFCHETSLAITGKWSAKESHLSRDCPVEVSEALERAASKYEGLTVELRGKAVFVYCPFRMPIKEWPEFYFQAQEIHELLSEC